MLPLRKGSQLSTTLETIGFLLTKQLVVNNHKTGIASPPCVCSDKSKIRGTHRVRKKELQQRWHDAMKTGEVAMLSGLLSRIHQPPMSYWINYTVIFICYLIWQVYLFVLICKRLHSNRNR